MPHVFDVTAARPAIQWSWLTLSGPDTQDFLHRLTTINVGMLQPGNGAPGFFLTAQGKIRAFFSLWRYATNDFAFEFDAGSSGHWKADLLAAIDQYTFAEKFELTDLGQLSSQWIFAETTEEAQVLASLGVPQLTVNSTLAVDEEIRICHHGVLDFGRAWITVWGRPARLSQWLERALPEATRATPELLEKWRIQANRPRVDAEITSNTIPLEAGLIDCLAQGKGCYPGQEVIERIVSLGAPARRLARIDGHGVAPSPGDLVFNLAEPPVEIGQVTSVMKEKTSDHFSALAFLRKIHAKEGLEVRLGQSANQALVARVAPYA
jgi:folate-binding protein YgfZ